MRSLSIFAFLFLTANSASFAAEQNVEKTEQTSQVEQCDQTADQAAKDSTAFAKLVAINTTFCTGSCERDFDCATGCSCAMNGSCH